MSDSQLQKVFTCFIIHTKTLQPEKMLSEEQKSTVTHYLMSFSMYNQYDIDLLCAYKQFVESTIIELGEDWRIESGLLSQEIVAIMGQAMVAEAESMMSERLEFNIFNQFLLPFLKDKLGNEKQACQASDSVIQDVYSEEVTKHFHLNQKITDSLTFKTLSLGFCIKAADMWVKSFSLLKNQEVFQYTFEPLGVLHKEGEKKVPAKKSGERFSIGASTIRNNFSNIDLGSCQQSNSEMQELQQESKQYKEANQKKWTILKDLSSFQPQQLKGISLGLKNAKFAKTQVLSNFAVNIHELKVGGKRVRIISTNSQFYRVAFIVWLIFNIKLFFSVSFEQYLVYFQKLMKNWQPSLESSLRKFYTIIEKQWNLLLKDYSVALHDDLQVLKSLINRVKANLAQDWKTKQDQIYKKLAH